LFGDWRYPDSDNLIAPSLSILFAVLSENDIKATTLLLLILSETSDELNWSASEMLIAPSLPMSSTTLSENEIKQQASYQYRVK
jgi:hypothetical protein